MSEYREARLRACSSCSSFSSQMSSQRSSHMYFGSGVKEFARYPNGPLFCETVKLVFCLRRGDPVGPWTRRGRSGWGGVGGAVTWNPYLTTKHQVEHMPKIPQTLQTRAYIMHTE